MLFRYKLAKIGLTRGMGFAIIINVVARAAAARRLGDNETILENDTVKENKVKKEQSDSERVNA